MSCAKRRNTFARSQVLVIATVCGLLSAISGHAQVLSTFTAGDSGWHLGTLALGNLDNTPDLEIVVPHRDNNGTWFVDAFKPNGQRLAGFPYSGGGDAINVSPVIADINKDGKNEIIITRANSVVALRGDGTVFWSSTVTPENYSPTCGFHTVTNGFYWSTDGSFSSRLPSSAVFSSEVSPPMAVDLNGNGNLEILTAWKIDPDPSTGAQDYNPFIYEMFGAGQWGLMGETWSGGVMGFSAQTGKPTFTYHMHHLVESGLAVGRATPAGPLHIYELNDSDSVVAFDKSKPFGLWGKGMLHKQFGKNQRLMSGSYQFPVDIYTADVDGDGLDEVLVPGIQPTTLWQPNETILDDDGAILWRRWLPHLDIVNNAGWLNSASMIPCNPDHDNRVDVLSWNHGYEISFRSWNGAEMEDRPGWPKSFYPLLPTPPVVGDVDGDGQEEIVIGTYDSTRLLAVGSLYVFSLNGTLKQTIPVTGGVKQIPALGDVFGRGQLDIVYRSTLGQVFVQNLGGKSSSAISWATHRGNMKRDGNLGKSLYPAGTPLVTTRKSGANSTSFEWTNASSAQSYRVYRSDNSKGPFVQVAVLPGDSRSYIDSGLKQGWEYFYELAAVYPSGEVRSAPFAVLSFLSGNLLVNSGFEECENSHWDKWYTGTLGMTNMSGCTNHAFQGRKSMRLDFRDQASSGSIAQFNQYGIPDSALPVKPGTYYSFGGFIKSDGLSQPSRHWLQWGSAKTGADTNNRPALPWPNFFTPSADFGTGPSEWTYVNRTFKLPNGFPNLELFHNFSMSAPGSGSVYLDNIFFRSIPDPNSAQWEPLVSFGSYWRYSTASASGWEATQFNDSSWPLAKAKFGAGGGPTNVSTRLPQLKPSYFFRTKFVLSSAEVQDLLLAATCTDDSGSALYPIKLYINGSEVKSTIDTVTSQGNQVKYFDLTPYSGMLRMGTNTVAVQLDNCWSDWDDVAFDVSLLAVRGTGTKGRLAISFPTANSPKVTVDTPSGSAWRLESSDRPGQWDLMQSFTNSSGSLMEFIDQGQNGRQLPAKVQSRFYRLSPM